MAAFSCIFVACILVMVPASEVIKTLQKLIRKAYRCPRTTSKKFQKIVSRGIRNDFGGKTTKAESVKSRIC